VLSAKLAPCFLFASNESHRVIVHRGLPRGINGRHQTNNKQQHAQKQTTNTVTQRNRKLVHAVHLQFVEHEADDHLDETAGVAGPIHALVGDGHDHGGGHADGEDVANHEEHVPEDAREFAAVSEGNVEAVHHAELEAKREMLPPKNEQ